MQYSLLLKKLREKMDPSEIIEKGLAAGMNEVGVLFERGKLFLPHVMMAADAMTAGVAALKDLMPEGASELKNGRYCEWYGRRRCA